MYLLGRRISANINDQDHLEKTISQLASRESSQHSVDVRVGTRSQRNSPVLSALPVPVTVKKQ